MRPAAAAESVCFPVRSGTGPGQCLLHGRQGQRRCREGPAYEEIAHSIDSCLLCGACEVACPEGIGLADLNIHQRQELNRSRTSIPPWYPDENFETDSTGRRYRRQHHYCLQVRSLAGTGTSAILIMEHLGGTGKTALAADDGQDIARSMEAGLPVPDGKDLRAFYRRSATGPHPYCCRGVAAPAAQEMAAWQKNHRTRRSAFVLRIFARTIWA